MVCNIFYECTYPITESAESFDTVISSSTFNSPGAKDNFTPIIIYPFNNIISNFKNIAIKNFIGYN